MRLTRARALAMVARFDEARKLVADVRAELLDRGNQGRLAQSVQSTAAVEILAGNPAQAETYLADACELQEAQGAQGFLGTSLALRALTLYDLGRLDEADNCAARASEIGDADDMFTQLPWRGARAKVLARRGDHDGAELLAREAVEIADGTDMLNDQGDAYANLAEVLDLAGRHGEAAAALEEAVERFTRKGNVASAQRAEERLAGQRAT